MADSLQTEIALEHRIDRPSPPLAATSEPLLVASARNGEQLAYVELCRRHREIVFRTVLRITHNKVLLNLFSIEYQRTAWA
jgi:hypothetical protein